MNTTGMEQIFSGDRPSKTPSDIYYILVRRLNLFVITVSSIMTVTVALAILLPSEFRSTATILIEQQEIPQELVRSTVTSYADQRIQVISQHVMARSNLVKIIDHYQLYANERKLEPLEVIVDQMREDIDMSMVSADVVDPRSGRPTQATIAFTLSYTSDSPDLAQKVTNELTSLYLNENLKERSKRTTEAEDFLNNEAIRLRREIADLENKLATFKQENLNSLPQLVELNMQLMEKTERDLMEVDRETRALKERKVYLDSELAQLNPNLSTFSEDGQRILSPHDKLKALETKYTGLTAIYSDSHPDIIRIQKEIAVFREKLENDKGQQRPVRNFNNVLEKELYETRNQYDALKGKYADNHPDVRRLKLKIQNIEAVLASYADNEQAEVTQIFESLDADNPAYIQVQTQVVAAETELSALRAKKHKLEKKLTKYERRISNSPQVERKYKSLTRDYDNSWSKYQEIKAKLMEASLAKTLEIEQKGERFTLIDPPHLPEEPISPNRLAIIFLGSVFALGLGFGAVIYIENQDKSIRGTTVVENLLDIIPLAEIPLILTKKDTALKKRKKILVVLTVAILVVCIILVIHFFKMPLDVLWFLLQRRLQLILS